MKLYQKDSDTGQRGEGEEKVSGVNGILITNFPLLSPQVLHFFIGLGVLVSPLVADPFLSEGSCILGGHDSQLLH